MVMDTRNFINSAATIKNFKGQYIIASVDKQTGAMSVSVNPVVQGTEGDALIEAGRLAKAMPSKKFVVLRINAIASVQDVIYE